MNKEEEKAIFDLVYADVLGTEPLSTEKPDFMVKAECGLTLGVEITSLYYSDKHGEIDNKVRYKEDLLLGKRDVCKSDRNLIQLSRVSILLPNNTIIDDVLAMRIEGLSFEQSVRKIESDIIKKCEKAANYSTDCNAMDLVLMDKSSMFINQDIESMHHHFYSFLTSNIIKNCRYREIFLITNLFSEGQITLPLRGCGVIADLLSLIEVARMNLIDKSEQYLIHIALGALHFIGYTSVYFADRAEFLSVQFGAWDFSYSKGQVRVNDRVTQLRRFELSNTIESLYRELSPEQKEQVELISSKRWGIVRYLPMFRRN